ncbi:MAG: general secretion pathway protein GspK [Candidatus Omnitrophica bacterium]|nr:general secretion pathway protein GspK [Candidatus Omnitrophota bacterium]
MATRRKIPASGRRVQPSFTCLRPLRLPRLPRRGSVLIVVVWTLAILSILAAGLGVRASFALGAGSRWKGQFRAGLAAESLAQYALTQMAFDPTPGFDVPSEEWQNLSGWQSLNLADVQIKFDSLTDEDRRISLNTGSAEMLYALLTALGARPAQAEEVSQSIVDWRDEDHDEHSHGAENYHYRNLSPGYDCKDAPFENAEELLLVKGVTPGLYKALRPYVTVFGNGFLNLNTAEPFLLRTLGLSEQGIAGISAYRVGEDGLAGTEDDRALASTAGVVVDLAGFIPVEDQNLLTRAMQDKRIGVQSRDFSFTVSSETPALRSKMKIWCVVSRTGQIKAWREE